MSSLRAGVGIADITPPLGGSMAGYFQNRESKFIHDPLHVRCLVLESGGEKVAIAVCDLVAIAAPEVNAARHLIHSYTGIPLHHILISATHTHSGATTAGLFQAEPDPQYLGWLVTRIADCVRCAHHSLVPAKAGWTSVQAPGLAFNRRYYLKEGKTRRNPFDRLDQVVMNPGVQNPDVEKPAGPVDPELALFGVQTLEGEPLALLASFSLHYVGNSPDDDISADYFGMFCEEVTRGLNACGKPGAHERPGFLAILANACSGNINNVDVSQPFQQHYPYAHMREVATALATKAIEGWKQIQFSDNMTIQVREAQVELGTRRPTAEDAERALKILAKAGPVLNTPVDVYARETILMSDWPPKISVPVQAMAIGDGAIVTLPGEAFVELGLDIKKSSSFKPTLCIELANAYAGYIPTVQAHEVGGYETWRARSSFLEKEAAIKLVQTADRLLGALRPSSTSAPE